MSEKLNSGREGVGSGGVAGRHVHDDGGLCIEGGLGMTNGEKYKTVKERTEAFDAFCDSHSSKCEGCPLEKACDDDSYAFAWLELEAEDEKPLPCPFCGGGVVIQSGRLECTRPCCGYGIRVGSNYRNADEAIAAHNRVARAVADAKEKEAK